MLADIRANLAAACIASTIGILLAEFAPGLLAAPTADRGDRPVLAVPVVSGSVPVIDGQLNEPCWQLAAATAPFAHEAGRPADSLTRALVLRDADHLYVGVICENSGTSPDAAASSSPPPDITQQEHIALLIDSNHDQNSYYLIMITPQEAVVTSYNEHRPPWHDPTWNRRRPRFQFRTARTDAQWSAEFLLPLGIFDKNRELTSTIGLNIRRFDAGSGQLSCWHGDFNNPADAGVLTGLPPQQFAVPPLTNYAGMYQFDGGYRQGFNAPPDTGPSGPDAPPIELGPGSAHPGTTGEVRIELEEFLMGDNVHARALIWDLAVNEKTGELYILSEARRKSDIQLRVFNRHGEYLRTLMPLNPTLAAQSVRDLCQYRVREGSTELVVPKLFETCATEPSLYGEYWHLPQSLAIAPCGDLIMSNLFKRTLWRMRPDGSLPPEGWTSIHNPLRNEPFENAGWLIGPWHADGLQPYLAYGMFCLPGMCFDPQGNLYVSGGVYSPLSQFYSIHWEVPGRGQGESVWKYRLLEGTQLEPVRDFRFNGVESAGATSRAHLGYDGQPGADLAHFNQPSGLIVDPQLIVADCGNHRLQVFEDDGRLAASVTSFQKDGQTVPLVAPTALAMDSRENLFVLAKVDSERRLIRLKNWREPQLLAISDPLHAHTIRIALDTGVEPPLVWVANGAGPGTLLQLEGNHLAVQGTWAGDQHKLCSPVQYGYVPSLNIDPQTGDLYVEDNSYYHRGLYGEVYKVDQSGSVLKKWPPLLFTEVSDWDGLPIYDQAHDTPVFRYPDEPLFLDSLFGKDGRIYRWKRDDSTVQVLRFDRQGKPVPFGSTGSNALVIDELGAHRSQPRNHLVYRGMDVDANGTIYHVNSRDTIDVFDADGNTVHRDLIELMDVRGLLVDDQGSLYVIGCPQGPTATEEGYWTPRELHLCKFPSTGGRPVWSRRWNGVLGCGAGRIGWMQTMCVCLTPRLHQALDGKGYLFVANRFSVQVIDCATGRLAGEFGSYGNMDCRGPGSAYPHPELPFGLVATLAVWNDKLFVVDAINARIAKCRIVYEGIR